VNNRGLQTKYPFTGTSRKLPVPHPIGGFANMLQNNIVLFLRFVILFCSFVSVVIE
jgi:hypothetical protein